MAASQNDLFKKTGAGTVTTLAAPGKAAAATSITVGATTNHPTDTGIVIAIRQVDSAGELVAGTYTEWSATVTSGTTFGINAVPVYGSDQVYAAGSTTQVYIPLSAYAHNELIDGILVEHNQDGTHSDITATSLTLAGVPHEKAAINAPQGFLINGKIVRTVTSNNITVAIKTLAGTDPSATDPVYCRIGDTVRAITAALSVTKNAGTNWFGSGDIMFATLEVDYFVYLGYNATDGVTIGFARIPYARLYSDFSTTSTDETYCAISNITNAGSGDEYENIGRFNAILSATASFNWSVPGTSIILNRPTLFTRELTYVPTTTTLALGTGGTLTAKYAVNNRNVDVVICTVLGTSGTHASGSSYSTPFTISSSDLIGQKESSDTRAGQFLDSSLSDMYFFFVRFESTTTMRPIYLGGATGASSGVPPATPATTDRFYFKTGFRI